MRASASRQTWAADRVTIAITALPSRPERAFLSPTGLGREEDFGTDGGMHNFLRYLENRGANGATVNYSGSLISMYYSQYNTGKFKCCNAVYGAPTRNYFFDTQFLNPIESASWNADVPGRGELELSPKLHSAVTARVAASMPRRPATRPGHFSCLLILSDYPLPGSEYR